MERPTCKTCPYWDVFNREPFDEGDCRKQAPRAYLDSEFSPSEQGNNAYWPVTTEIDWCGEHPDFPAYLEGLKKTAE